VSLEQGPEPVRAQRAEVVARGLAEDELADELAGDGGEHEAEVGVAGRDDEVVDSGGATDDRQAVGVPPGA
jgi:hypothetical protein